MNTPLALTVEVLDSHGKVVSDAAGVISLGLGTCDGDAASFYFLGGTCDGDAASFYFLGTCDGDAPSFYFLG